MNRSPATQWKKGQSGNPKGRPKIAGAVIELARSYAEDSIRALGEIVRNRKCHPGSRVRAAEVLLDRGYGKAPQNIEVNVVEAMSDIELLETARRILLEKDHPKLIEAELEQ